MPGEKEPMTTAEAGRRGGTSTFKKYGPEFYHKIGTKGGHRVRELIQKAKGGMK
ncbi:Em GEA1 (EM1) [bacterium CG_4_10_14_0_2_um_filter_33_32]|nr:MAG: Em GEA1 (EM1) [bacterium CG2_30_33_46]PIR67674.1 MAG: Em GEA1 (EM1) [bacterium CG10_big_fil_rev_8_21_14_0_10_33_18]PIU76510.1 MAG: Em GEA1 (EM1) [bacterium CG06_land_8_20_14_3_00_33_50]PIW80942.1 MAG: Em GEA1 (EM1) [bacterium CG_4_8_14_3_um_filter_33_28]PIY85766.1 MAG: Em GEA1 (EM1) [bacterium CG_4_10_14_0_8_um_filter_33_57]PIZ86074.1 MAG: Em GEA1 (EM1) [bacterium CG_4_10_14_0_2_um_filter_33_32]PJA71888.1 MAG: Em GEA1 (EM1) [bacterium CG_4_9_14_3_um_filter_33_26]